ncbi:MAG: hypothetical protein KKH94_04815 [Candidatus Omnitrophica bacterium]|nr:hypothetical protein [Candidatus Omnitrophota bacterium]
MNKKVKFLCITVSVVILVICTQTFVFQTRNLVDIPVLFLLAIVGVLFVMWFRGLKKKDKDKGMM